MEDKTYLGKVCKWGHDDGTGHTLRGKAGNCLECLRLYRATPNYKDYQRRYHENQRKNAPERHEQYRCTQVAKGNTYPKYQKEKQND